MSGLRQQLLALLARFDEDGFVALANRGLLRRAQKDLEKLPVDVADETADELTVAVGEHRIRFDARGPAYARCSCPATGVCQHVLSAALGLQRLASAQPVAVGPEQPADPLAPLRAELLRITAAELSSHAGKAGYRWAWQFAHDADLDQAVTVGGDQHLVIGFRSPRMTLRYMGGGIGNLVADIDIKPVEKYRVAAVLAFQRVHGVELAAPEPADVARIEALDLGMDHRVAAPASGALGPARQRFRASARQLLAEAVELGLAHLSEGMQERFATLAVWAQGCEYHRLALLLRRVADHVELLLQRAGGADEHRLLDEMAFAFAILCALDEAAVHGQSPAHLVGQARTRYEASSALELWGLGAYAWRSPSGYRGLTLIFWSPADQCFFSCTDARPEGLRGFDPVARYKAAGPWSGLGAPALATGRRVLLTGAMSNAAGRLSAADSATAAVLPEDPPGAWAGRLKPWLSWAGLVQARDAARRSLLAEPRPMQDWVFLRPARFGAAQFDPARQTLCWPLFDADGQCLMAELAFDAYTAPAIGRIEALEPGTNQAGTLVVARIRPGVQAVVAEPLSLVHGTGGRAVDALYFDAAPAPGRSVAARLVPPQGDAVVLAKTRSPVILQDTRHALQRQAERGLAADQRPLGWASAARWVETCAEAGLSAFAALNLEDTRAGEGLLRLNFVCLQYDHLFGAQVEGVD